MAVLLSNATARRLLSILDDGQRKPLRADKAASVHRAAPAMRSYPHIWLVRWDATLEAWIVFAPAKSARILELGFDEEEQKVTASITDSYTIANDAAENMLDWYLVEGTGSATIYAVLEDAAIRITTSPSADADDQIALAVATIDDDGATLVKQLVRSTITLISDPADEDDDESPGGGALPPCGHPGNNDGGGATDEDDQDHPGDDPSPDDPVDGRDGDSDTDTDHPGDDPSPPSGGECDNP